MRKFLRLVTVTGADDSTDIGWMVSTSKAHPWVEWGILLSESKMGKEPRFPSSAWLTKLAAAKRENPGMRLSAHVCGAWAREFLSGHSPFSLINDFWKTFSRVQLNVVALREKTDVDAMVEALRRDGVQWILQHNEANGWLLEALEGRSLDVVGLFDGSGGKGILPGEWPEDGGPCWGYAGGLRPDNVADQLSKIEKVSGDGAWIDAESGLRSQDGSRLDEYRTEAYLLGAAEWVKPAPRPTVIPLDLPPLDGEELQGLMEGAFDAEGPRAQAFAFDGLEMGVYQRLLLDLLRANQTIGTLRHWVANAGSNVKKPVVEARILFVAASSAVDLVLGTPEDLRDGLNLLSEAVSAVALSRAGTKDIDVAAWAEREAAIQRGKPFVQQIKEMVDGRNGQANSFELSLDGSVALLARDDNASVWALPDGLRIKVEPEAGQWSWSIHNRAESTPRMLDAGLASTKTGAMRAAEYAYAKRKKG